MEILQLLSSHPVIVGIVVGIVAIAGLCCCCCLCCSHHHRNHRSSATQKPINVTPSQDLESGSLNDLELTKQPPKLRTKGDYTLLNTDEPEDYPDLPAPTVSADQEIERPVTKLPDEFYTFITQKIIPYFNGQRKNGHQFAVVVLLSENDFDTICETSFIPSESGKPILNKYFSAMPQDHAKYGNYIVARPFSNSCHSEEEIFGWQYSPMINTPFSHLWRAYLERNSASPKCILIYSWYLPCSRCTDAIIRSLGEEPYNSVSVILAHTRFWHRESLSDQNKNREKLASKKITVQMVGCPIWIPPA